VKPSRIAFWLVRLSLPVALAAVVGYVLIERSRVRVGIDSITYLDNLGGGFVAVGTCADQPGVLILSTVDRKDVPIRAEREQLRLRTTLSIDLDGRVTRRRLTGPTAVLIAPDRPIEFIALHWKTRTFYDLLAAIDCDGEHQSSDEHPLCGKPFEELLAYLKQHPPGAVPQEVIAFARRAPTR